MQDVLKVLKQNGFDAHYFDTAAQAAAYLTAHVAPQARVGIGGCLTAQQMNLSQRLRQAGHTVNWHWECEKEEVEAVRARAFASDVYIASANALTRTGVIMNSDGAGNRVASTFYGPKDVWFVVGRNKVVDSVEDGMRRIDTVASPLNAQRLNLPADRKLYNVTVLLERPTTGRNMHVLVIGEDLGY